MGLICNCPNATSLNDVPLSTCPESFGQIQKVIFQRLYDSTGAENKVGTSTNLASTLSAWTSLVTASDSTKVVVSPYIQAPSSEAGSMRTYGGGNDTLNGIEINIGTEPTTFTGTLLREKSETIKALKTFMCELELGVFLIDENGHIGGIATGTDGIIKPIPIHSFFVGDKNLGGYDAPDSNAISWKFKPNWSDDLVRVVPATGFNPLTDIK